MKIDLTKQDIEVIRTSLHYSKERVANAEGTPYEVRKENLNRIETALQKLSPDSLHGNG